MADDDTPDAGLKALAAAATHFAPQAGDPKISAAFLLGWRIGLAHDWAAKGKHEAWPDDDPGLADSGDRWAVLTEQIAGAATALGADAKDLGSAPPAETAVADCRTAVLKRLYVDDHFRGIAFTLGVQLEGFCAGTRRLEPAKPLAADIPQITKSLVALATKFPPHAARAVINSLSLWEEQLGRPDVAFDAEKLRLQGGVWRSMLAADVAAKDLLRLSDYIGTAELVVARLHEFALRALRSQLALPALVAFALLVGGLLAMFLSDKVAAGATSVAVALGLSWKGIGQYFGRVAAQGEQALWEGQLDWAIAYRATISLRDPRDIKARDVLFVGTRRHFSQRGTRRRKGHYYTWQKWLRTWPDFELYDK